MMTNERFDKYGRQERRGGEYAPVDLAEIYARDGGICHICGDHVSEEEWSPDHIIALAAGGDHTPENVAVSHWGCNMLKGAGHEHRSKVAHRWGITKSWSEFGGGNPMYISRQRKPDMVPALRDKTPRDTRPMPKGIPIYEQIPETQLRRLYVEAISSRGKNKQVNFRASRLTLAQLRELGALWGTSASETIRVCVAKAAAHEARDMAGMVVGGKGAENDAA